MVATEWSHEALNRFNNVCMYVATFSFLETKQNTSSHSTKRVNNLNIYKIYFKYISISIRWMRIGYVSRFRDRLNNTAPQKAQRISFDEITLTEPGGGNRISVVVYK